MSEIIKKFNILNKLNEQFLNEIKLLYVFENNENKKSVLIVTNGDKAFAFGNNSNGVLWFLPFNGTHRKWSCLELGFE